MTDNAPTKSRRAIVPGAGLLIAALAPGVASAADAEWRSLGPAPIQPAMYSGRVSAVAVHPGNLNTWYVSGADGGVWRTIDAGASWAALGDDLPTTAIGAIAIDPTNPQIIYAGSGEANFANHSRYGLGIFKSTDAGETWEQLAAATFAGRCFSKIIIPAQSPTTIYASITRAGGFPEMAAARNHPLRLGPVGVFRSLDSGQTWTQLTNGLPNLSATDLAIDPINPLILYAGIGHIFGNTANGIYKSADGGDSWVRLSGGLPTAPIGRIGLGVAPSLSSRLYAMITRPADAFGGGASALGAWRSDDSGQNWVSLPAFVNPQASYGWYLSVVSVHPTNPNQVWFGGVDFRVTTNAGSTFSVSNPPHVDIHGMAWYPDGSQFVLASDGGVHHRNNLLFRWTARNDGLGLIQCYAGVSVSPAVDDIVLAGMQDNGTNLRNDDSENWASSLGGDGGWTQIDSTQPSIAFAEFQGTGNLFRSEDGGATFPAQVGAGINPGDRNCFLPPYLIDPSNPQRMYYATQRLYRSLDGGFSWTPVSSDLTGGSGAIRALAMAPSNPAIIYAATNDSRFLRSDDSGQSFTLLLTDAIGWPRVTREIFVHPNEPLTVYLAGSAFGVSQLRRTTDGGKSWTALDANLPDLPINTVTTDTRSQPPVIFVGTDAGLLRSVDDGGHWYRYGSALPNAPIIDLILEPQRGRILAATQGRGVWAAPIALLGDINCDGAISVSDIGPFVLALSNPAGYAAQFPDCLAESADITGDGNISVSDIGPFVTLLAQ